MSLALITGSSGLIGSDVCSYFARGGFTVHGLDNNQRAASSARQGTLAGTSAGSSRKFEVSCITSWTCGTAKASCRW